MSPNRASLQEVIGDLQKVICRDLRLITRAEEVLGRARAVSRRIDERVNAVLGDPSQESSDGHQPRPW